MIIEATMPMGHTCTAKPRIAKPEMIKMPPTDAGITHMLGREFNRWYLQNNLLRYRTLRSPPLGLASGAFYSEPLPVTPHPREQFPARGRVGGVTARRSSRPEFLRCSQQQNGFRLSRGLERQPSTNLNVPGLAARGYLSERTTRHTAIGRI
jgi:hypothetical protein